MNLFQVGDFTLASGAKSTWKLECGALTEADWDGLAEMTLPVVGPFSSVEGVPRGGVPFAEALHRLAVRRPFPRLTFFPWPRLIVDDVWTTGGTMRKYAESAGLFAPGRLLQEKFVVAFARGPLEYWCKAIFQLPPELWIKK